MSHLSGTFSHPSACQLLVVLTAEFTGQGTAYMNNGAYVSIRGYLGPSGAYNYTRKIDRYAESTAFELNYPGGGVVWNVGTETTEVNIPQSGVYHFGAFDIRMVIRVTKR